MKKKFSKYWNSSRQPRKQRKYRANAPLHIRHKLVSVNLSKALREKYGRRSYPVRKGDVIKIMRGESKGKSGKVSEVNLKMLKIFVEGIEKKKVSGQNALVPIDPSNVRIVEINLDDSFRKKSITKQPVNK